MKLIKAMATVAGLTGISRVAGFIRDVLTAAMLGAGPVADAFFVALKLPNFFRRVTAEGAFSVSFVPIYTEISEKEGREAAGRFAGNAFMVMLTLLLGFVLLAVWAMPWVIYAVAPGFTGDEIRFDLAVELTRITFPYLLLISLTALLGAVLNAMDRFAPFAFAPVLFNLCVITALLWTGKFDTAGHAMAYGVLGAGVVQLVWLWESARYRGAQLKFGLPRFDTNIKKVFKLMGPGVVGAGVMHINLFVDVIIGSFLGTGAISYLYYADRLNQLPLGIVGIAVGTALLPMLSRALARGDEEEARSLFNRSLEMCLLLALPAAAALMVMPGELISVLFERGKFTYIDTQETAYVLALYAVGLPAYIAVKVFSTAHWARQDTVTPVKIAIAATITNIIMSLMFVWYIGVAGIALATALAGWMQLIAHLQALKDHPAAQFDDRLKRATPRIIFSVAIMTFFLFLFQNILGYAFQGGEIVSILALFGMIIAGGMIYFTSIFALQVVRIRDIPSRIGKDVE